VSRSSFAIWQSLPCQRSRRCHVSCFSFTFTKDVYHWRLQRVFNKYVLLFNGWDDDNVNNKKNRSARTSPGSEGRGDRYYFQVQTTHRSSVISILTRGFHITRFNRIQNKYFSSEHNIILYALKNTPKIYTKWSSLCLRFIHKSSYIFLVTYTILRYAQNISDI